MSESFSTGRSNTLETAAESAERMGARWRTTNVSSAWNFAGGLYANLLDNPTGEASGPPANAEMLILVVRGERHHLQWHDHRQNINGPLPDGALTLIPAGRAPRAVVSKTLRVLLLHAPISLINSMHVVHGGAAQPVELIDPHLEHDPLLSGPMSLLACALESDEPFSRFWLDAVGTAICARAIQRWSNVANVPIGPKPAPTKSDWRLRRCIEYIEANLAKDLSVAELAAVVGLTATHVTTLFRAGTGEPPHRWLMRRRLKRACELLGERQHSFTEVAITCGFASSQHMASVFQRRLRTTPGAYRKSQLT